MAQNNFKNFLIKKIEEKTNQRIENLSYEVRVELFVDFIYSDDKVLGLVSREGKHLVSHNITALFFNTLYNMDFDKVTHLKTLEIVTKEMIPYNNGNDNFIYSELIEEFKLRMAKDRGEEIPSHRKYKM